MDKVVVGAAIVDGGGRLLAAQRAEPPELAGGWEFPGGKVDPGEDDRTALIRECQEELGVLVEIGEQIGGDWPLTAGYVLRIWLAEIVDGEPEAKEHLELRWLAMDELYGVRWLPADLPVVRAVQTHLGEVEP
ncbi:(deoxy)nucleoside triphosphate pyrophosphohydrolase [Streptosporangium sp. NBC_01639]|uniref:(deoxy)nucleoside triphosphate pyrophosphohydrolase n=1 Tax=unclassified Streptosporangium TaxID=2632669 RepID=UPI002DD8ABB1|nr:(deoxy)nucleoside triphosphate pyrophosphohydrolase [Streptosporangium sp. NBC_01756]WSC89249.1 (deoxy)nucleoside triphosphate pyrophosphohydrolase [Streptosporangium sp. NBC_01756]WTD52080.1 (deoxy)nucleoside triphosphate pyrophosphohydrolase [Streptosporangium sp. NBC_01639]